MAHYVVTGASGFLGSTIVEELIKQGHKVTVTLRTKKYLSAMYRKDTDCAYGDIRDVKFLDSIIKKDSIVIHAAGITALGKENKNEMFDINYTATKNLTDICIKNHAKKLVFISSVDVICHYKGHHEMHEPEKFEIDKLATPYAQSKALASQYVLEKARAGLLNANVIYPTCFVGPGDDKISFITQLILDYIKGEKVYSVKGGKYNFVDIRDVAAATIKIAQSAPSGEDYIIGGESTLIDDMFEIVSSKVDMEKPKSLSRLRAKFRTFFVNIGKSINNNEKVYSSYYIDSFFGNHNFSSEKAKRELGYTTRPLEETFGDTVDWLKKYKKDLIDEK